MDQQFHRFEWPVKDKEASKANKDAYFSYLSKFVEKFHNLKVKLSNESLHLKTVVGTSQQELSGEADMHIIPVNCKSITRNYLSMVFEMKPGEISTNNVSQAIGYVIAANSLFESTHIVLSDFIEQWKLILIGKDGEVC